jgi:hypothetical protein
MNPQILLPIRHALVGTPRKDLSLALEADRRLRFLAEPDGYSIA